MVKGNTYPLPRKEVLFDKIKDKKIFSKFDCKSGFFQIELEEFCKEYTAFSVPNGHCEWNVLLLAQPCCKKEWIKFLMIIEILS